MGMNYYIKGTLTHVGKRSAAGYYCWDCNTTLCKDGTTGIHQSCHVKGHSPMCNCNWYQSCPKCGKTPKKETLETSSVGRELGFNEQSFKRKTGVASCASFTWAIKKEDLPKRRKIVDEVDREYSREAFLQVLEECPVQFYHAIGTEFS